MNRVGLCRSCGRQVVYLKHHRTGTPAPIEYASAANGNIIPIDREGDPTTIETAKRYRIKRKDEVVDVPVFLNHFASCAQAARWAQKKRASA